MSTVVENAAIATPDPRRWQLPLVAVVSAVWESLFLNRGSNTRDEGWALYAGMQLDMGRSLYQDISWVFPPGHALPSWLGYVLDPGGWVIPRVIYALFTVALCVALYELGRKLSPPVYAMLGALLLAIAAPRSHLMQLLYGYRYMFFAVVVLLFFARRLERDDARAMFSAGLFAGVSLFFRVTPAFAVSCGIAAGILASSRDYRRWFGDGFRYAAGLLLVIVPVIAWFAVDVGLARLWGEIILRPVAMLQPLPLPELAWPEDAGWAWMETVWHPAAARFFLLLYGVYALGLAISWGRALLARRPFEHVLLLAIVVWGGVFFVRSFGRADEPHMDTTLPATCLLLGHATGLAVERLRAWRGWGPRAGVLACATGVLAWAFLSGLHLSFPPHTPWAFGMPPAVVNAIGLLDRRTERGISMLDLTASPHFHVLADRPGPGYADVVMEGTFFDDDEEAAFLARVQASPPGAVLWPAHDFDHMPSRAIQVVAPRLAAWAEENYRRVRKNKVFVLMVPKEAAGAESAR